MPKGLEATTAGRRGLGSWDSEGGPVKLVVRFRAERVG